MVPSLQELPPDPAQRAADVLELLAKVGGSLLLLWGFVAKIAKPFIDWRRQRLQQAILGALKDDQSPLKDLAAQVKRSIERQDQVFTEVDLLVSVLAEVRDRQDDFGNLLNEVGFASTDRRASDERRRFADDAMAELQGRLRARRRGDGNLSSLEPT